MQDFSLDEVSNAAAALFESFLLSKLYIIFRATFYVLSQNMFY